MSRLLNTHKLPCTAPWHRCGAVRSQRFTG